MRMVNLPANRIAKYEEHQSVALGSEAEVGLGIYLEIYHSFYDLPASRDNIVKEFYHLVAKWREDTRYFSSLTDICMHPCYQRIIGMGKSVLPLIFFELERESNHWFWALTNITGEDPISIENRGNMPGMRNAWLEWGRKHNFIW